MMRIDVLGVERSDGPSDHSPASFDGLGKAGKADRKIQLTIAYMLEHLNQPVQVAKLAALANISPSHFFALFKQQTGCAPIDFFIRLRMQQACRLLDNTTLNVKEVAAVLGYDDPFYFSRTFKTVNHIAPSDYRVMSAESRKAVKSAVWPTSSCGHLGTCDRPVSSPKLPNYLDSTDWLNAIRTE